MSDEAIYTDDVGKTLYYYERLSPVFYTTTALSLATNLVVCLFHGLTFYRVVELNRISLRLIALSSCCEVIIAAFRMAMIVPADLPACSADSFFVSWAGLASPLCLALVAVHTVCVLVLNVDHPRQLEKYYYATILIYSTVVAGVSARHTPVGYVHDLHCWVRYYFGKKTVNAFEWTWYYTALLISITVAVVCCLILVIRYKMERYNFVATSVRYARNNTTSVLPVLSNRFQHIDPIKIFRHVIIRSFFYALIPLISKLSIIIAGYKSLRSQPVSYQSLVAGGVLTNVQGVLISILYFSDPAVVYTVKRFGHFLRKVYVDDYDLASNKSSDFSPSPPDSFDDRMRERYGPEFGESTEGDWGGAIQLTPIHHDMIASDNMEEDQPFYSNGNSNNNDHHSNSDQRRRRRRSSARLWGKSYTKPPWNPYYNRCLAKTMHWVLTRVCRLKPLPFAESTSTLSYQSYALASHNSSSLSLNDNYAQQQQSPDNGNGVKKVTNATSDIKFRIGTGGDTTTTITIDDQDGAHMDRNGGKGDTDSKGKKDRQEKRGMTNSTSPIHPTIDDTQQYLMIPNTPTTKEARPASPPPISPLSSSSSPENTEGSPTSAMKSSDEEKSSGSNRGTLSSGSPFSTLRRARPSKKLSLGMLHHHRHDNNSPSESQQQQRSTPGATPSPASSTPATAAPSKSPPSSMGYDSSSSSKQSSLHLSQTSSLHLPGTNSSSDIDRLSLLLSSESGTSTNKGYEPLTAPPHHYHGHHRRHSRRRRLRRSRKRASKDTTLPALSITLPGETEYHQHQQQQQPYQVPLTVTTPPPSSASEHESSSFSSSSSSSGMGTITSRYHSIHSNNNNNKHGVKLQPSVLKALLLDWDPAAAAASHHHHHHPQHARLDQPLLKPDGLQDGWTTIVHIGQAWNGMDLSSSSSSNKESGDRIVSFVEHWFKDYLGSRWFVVE